MTGNPECDFDLELCKRLFSSDHVDDSLRHSELVQRVSYVPCWVEDVPFVETDSSPPQSLLEPSQHHPGDTSHQSISIRVIFLVLPDEFPNRSLRVLVPGDQLT